MKLLIIKNLKVFPTILAMLFYLPTSVIFIFCMKILKLVTQLSKKVTEILTITGQLTSF